jgi:hypothetical protein
MSNHSNEDYESENESVQSDSSSVISLDKESENEEEEAVEEEEEEEEEEVVEEEDKNNKTSATRMTQLEIKMARARKKEEKEDEAKRQERIKINKLSLKYPDASEKELRRGLTKYADFVKYINTKKIFKISEVKTGGSNINAPSGNAGSITQNELECIRHFKKFIDTGKSADEIKEEITNYITKNKIKIPYAVDVLYNFYVGYPIDMFVLFINNLSDPNNINRMRGGIRMNTLYVEFNNIHYESRIGYDILNALINFNTNNKQGVIDLFTNLKLIKKSGGNIEPKLISIFEVVGVNYYKLDQSIISLLLNLSTKQPDFINEFLEKYKKVISTKYPFEFFFEFYATYRKQPHVTSAAIQPPVSSTFSRNIMSKISTKTLYMQPEVPEYKLKTVSQIVEDLRTKKVVNIEDKPSEDINFKLIEDIINEITAKLKRIIPEVTGLFVTKMSDIINNNSVSPKEAHTKYELLKGIFKFSTKLNDNDNINFPKYVDDMKSGDENVDDTIVNIIKFISKFKYPEVTIRLMLAKLKTALSPAVKINKPPLFIPRTNKPKYISFNDDTDYKNKLLDYSKNEKLFIPDNQSTDEYPNLFDTSIKLNVFYFAVEELTKVLISINSAYEDGCYATLIIKEIEKKIRTITRESNREATLYDFSVELYELIIFLNKSIMRQLSNFVFINRVGLGYYSADMIINLPNQLKCPEIFNPVNTNQIIEIATDYLKQYCNIFIIGFIYKVVSIDSFSIMYSEFSKIVNVMNTKFTLESKEGKDTLMQTNKQLIKQFLNKKFRINNNYLNGVDSIEAPISVLDKMKPMFDTYKKYSGVIQKNILPEYKIKNLLIYNIPPLTFFNTGYRAGSTYSDDEKQILVLSSYFDGNTILSESGMKRTQENIMLFEKYYIQENGKLVGKFVNINEINKLLKNNSIGRIHDIPPYLIHNISTMRFPNRVEVYDKPIFDNEDQTILKNIRMQEKEQKMERLLSLKSDKNLSPEECNLDDFVEDQDIPDPNKPPPSYQSLSDIESGQETNIGEAYSGFSTNIKIPYNRINSQHKIKYKKLNPGNLQSKCSTCKKESINLIKSFHKKNDRIKNINFCSTKCMKKYNWS